MNDKPIMKDVEIKPLAVFSNPAVRFSCSKVMNQPSSDFQYVMMAEQGLMRITLGGTRDSVRAFLSEALSKIEAN